MKKRYGWVGILLLVFMVAGIVFARLWDAGVFLPPDDSLTSWTPAESTGESTGPETEEESSSAEPEGPPLADVEAANFMLPAYTRIDGVIDAPYGVTYTVHSVEITKDLPEDMRLPNYYECDYMIDLDGTIVRDYSYVIVDMTVVNNEFSYGGIELGDFALNGIQVAAVNRERIFDDYLSFSEDAVSISNDIPGAGSAEPIYPGLDTWYATAEFETGDTLRYKAACILRDSDLEAAEHLILIPTAVCTFANGWLQYDNVKKASYWNNGVRAILLDDYVAGQPVPEATYDAPISPRPVCTEGELTFGDDERYRMTVEQVNVLTELPEDVRLVKQREPQPGVNPDGTLAEGYVWLQVGGVLEVQHANVNVYHFGSDQLYFYRGEERLGYLYPYALQTDDTVRVNFSSAYFLHCELSSQAPTVFSYFYAVPEEALQDDTDLLLFVCGFHCQQGYQTEYYDRENRCCYWNPFADFAALTPYVK